MPPPKQEKKLWDYIPPQLLIWLITMIFLGGVAYSAFATKSYVDDQVEKNLGKVEKRLERIESLLMQERH